jgi:hypothetical protein
MSTMPMSRMPGHDGHDGDAWHGRVSKDGKPVTNLQPYLDTYAHPTAFHHPHLLERVRSWKRGGTTA